MHYEEGVFVGYRWYDVSASSRALFGHGLSYVVHARITDGSSNEVSLDQLAGGATPRRRACAQHGGAARREVAQCYVYDAEASVDRPVHELKAFAKVWLEPASR